MENTWTLLDKSCKFMTKMQLTTFWNFYNEKKL